MKRFRGDSHCHLVTRSSHESSLVETVYVAALPSSAKLLGNIEVLPETAHTHSLLSVIKQMQEIN